MPIAVIEAQVAGIPAVVSDVVGNRDVVLEGRTGFIGASEPALAEALQTLIDDAPRREQMGREARAQALARFGLPRLFDELLRAYGLTGPQEAGR
jgi:glycosyltransferase involved in cell wall biosynthesis